MYLWGTTAPSRPTSSRTIYWKTSAWGVGEGPQGRSRAAQAGVHAALQEDHAGTEHKWKSSFQSIPSFSKSRRNASLNIHKSQGSHAIIDDRAKGESLATLGRILEADYERDSLPNYSVEKQARVSQPHEPGARAGGGSKGYPRKPFQGSSSRGKDSRRAEPAPSAREEVLGAQPAARDSSAAGSMVDAIERLHQQLDSQSDSFLGATNNALSKDEAEAVRVKLREQREKGLQAIREKLRSQGLAKGDDGDTFFHGVDPETLVPDEYVVHKKVGVGRFIGMKYEMPEGKSKAAKYVYLQYADGKAKVKAKQAHRLLYRYNL